MVKGAEGTTAVVQKLPPAWLGGGRHDGGGGGGWGAIQSELGSTKGIPRGRAHRAGQGE